MMIGLYAMIAKNNLVKKIVGMNIFQTAIILFYVSIGAKRGATIPIWNRLTTDTAPPTGHPGRGLHQSAAPRADAHRHCGLCRHPGGGTGPGHKDL